MDTSLVLLIITGLTRAAAGLLVAAWVVWSLRRIYTAVTDVASNWERWDTYPIPDKRATWNIAVLLAIIAGWLLFTAGIVAYVAWVSGAIP